MPILNDATRAAVWTEWMAENKEPVSIDKAAVRIAINEIDDWVEAQLAGALTAISEPALSALSVDQKFALFNKIVRRRVE